MNEINLDKIGVSVTPGKIEKNTKQPESVSVQNKEGITVTNNMNNLVNLINGPEHEEQARVVEMKERIKSGDYQVNIHQLSEKMINSGILRNLGE